MNRREFIQSMVVTTAACVGTVSAAQSRADGVEESRGLTLYDPRFAQAHELARQLAPSGELRSVAGDISELVPLVRSMEHRGKAFKLAGVTTESVPFCLEQLLCSFDRPALEMRRLDADLFAWTLRSV